MNLSPNLKEGGAKPCYRFHASFTGQTILSPPSFTRSEVMVSQVIGDTQQRYKYLAPGFGSLKGGKGRF